MHHDSSFSFRNAPNTKTDHEPHHSDEMLPSPTLCPQPLRCGFSCLETHSYNSLIFRRMLRSLCCAILTALMASMSSLPAK